LNAGYQKVANAIKKTATRDLNDLKEKGLIEQVGHRGPGVHYVLLKKRDKMGTIGTFLQGHHRSCSKAKVSSKTYRMRTVKAQRRINRARGQQRSNPLQTGLRSLRIDTWLKRKAEKPLKP
jgi:hypothetical protein